MSRIGKRAGHHYLPIQGSARDVHHRVVTALEALIDAHPGQRIAVSCHGGVINSYVGHVLGLPVGQHFFYPNYTSIHRIVASRRGHREVVTLNETAQIGRAHV